MMNYEYCYKEKVSLSEDDISPEDYEWDVFISSFNLSERVNDIFEKVRAKQKIWLVQPDYNISTSDFPKGNVFFCDNLAESEYIEQFFNEKKISLEGKNICLDITGFVKPLMMYFMAWMRLKNINKYDIIYSEPEHYVEQEKTKFSDEIVREVRQVSLYEGSHVPDVSNDILIIGAGYDHKLMAHVASNKRYARKYKMIGFPSLRPDMYQQNILRINMVEEEIKKVNEDCLYAPAYDPFITAKVLSETVAKVKPTNLYLSPLATKPQALGFAYFYLNECVGKPVSMIYPYCDSHAQRTSDGINRIWRYTLEFNAANQA